MTIPCPTGEQCTEHAVVCEDGNKIGYAIWYPQMGGYTGRAVAVMDKEWFESPNGSRTGGCIDVHVWHDGEFPFPEEDGPPRVVHHCDPEQFVEFGRVLGELNEAQGRRVDAEEWQRVLRRSQVDTESPTRGDQ